MAVKPVHKRLGAMMPGPDGHAIIVNNRRNIMWMRAVHGEGHNTGFPRCSADQL